MPNYSRFSVACEIYGEDGRLISVMDNSISEDQAIFKSVRVNFSVNDLASSYKVLFSFVFGFNGPIKPSKIKITPRKSDVYNIGRPFCSWYMNDEFFPRQKSVNKNGRESDPEMESLLKEADAMHGCLV